MFIPKKEIKILNHQDQCCADTFSLLCWNVAKVLYTGEYKHYLDTLLKDEDIALLLLQEAREQIGHQLGIDGYSYILSPNIQIKDHLFGVLSAFKISCENTFSILTKKRELTYATHKVALITQHKLPNGQKLTIVNLHAINFVKNNDFYEELQILKSAIISYQGAMIVAGDFNTWNNKRMEFLKKFAKDLGLEQVMFHDSTHLKKVFSNTLDHIFYRGLQLLHAKIINSHNISDHNPIIARFQLKQSPLENKTS